MSKLLIPGDVIKIEEGMNIYADVPEHFVYSNRKGSFKKVHEHILIDENFNYFCGNYVVLSASYEGGGYGMGVNDVFPDGWHVYCLKDDKKTKIDFYQTGCFTAMIEDIKPIGKANLEWSFNEENINT